MYAFFLPLEVRTLGRGVSEVLVLLVCPFEWGVFPCIFPAAIIFGFHVRLSGGICCSSGYFGLRSAAWAGVFASYLLGLLCCGARFLLVVCFGSDVMFVRVSGGRPGSDVFCPSFVSGPHLFFPRAPSGVSS